MPYKKLEFATLCGLTPGNLSNYIKRGKVTVNDQEEIDGTLPGNKYFLDKRLKHLENKKLDEYEGPDQQPVKGKGKHPAVIVENKDPIDKHIRKDTMFDLDRDQKSLDIQKRHEEIELLKLKKEKAQGIVIPTDQVKMIFAQHSKSITVSFYNAADNLLMKVAKLKGLNRNEMAELRGDLIDFINIAVKESIEESKKNIKNIVREYSEKKGVGERE